MKSIIEYNKNGYYNSLHAYITEDVCMGTDLFINRGKNLDNIFEKMSIHNYRLRHGGYINESYINVDFNINEQFAARDLLINIATEYAYSLYESFCIENDMMVEEGIKDAIKSVKGGVSALIDKTSNFVKQTSNKAKEGYEKFVDKLKQVKKFIEDVKNKAIKSAKELVNKITEMMTSLGCSLVELIKKLGGNSEESYKEFEGMVEEAFKDEKKQKENIYESFGKQFSLILEGSNEYEEAGDAKNGSNGSKLKNGAKMLGSAMLKIILQMMAYYAVTIVLPAVVGLIAGPLAAAIVACIAKIVWSSTTIWKQVTDMRKTCQSEEYKQSPKWMKALRWTLFILSIAGSAFTLVKGLGDAFKIGKAIFEGAAGTVLPDEAVQSCMKILNNFWKTLTGSDAPGYEALLKAQNQTWTELKEVTSAEQKASDAGQEKFDTHKSNDFKASETNNFQHTEDIAGNDLANKLKALSDENINGSMKVLNAAKEINVNTPGVTAFGIDGSTLGKIGRAEYIQQIADKIGIDPSNIDISQVTNLATKEATKGAAGTFFQVVIKGDATAEMADKVSKAVNQVADAAGTTGWFHMFSKVADFSSTTTEIIKHPMELIKTSFSAFGGLFPIALKNFKTGGFKLRLASKESNYNLLYYIESKDDIKEMTFKEAKEKYGSLNSNVFTDMEKIVNTNYKALKKFIENKEKENSLSKDDKKRIDAMSKQLTTMQEATDDYKLLIFYGKEITGKKAKETKANEAKEEKQNDEKIPVMFINPMMMGCGDLARQSTNKKPRSKMWYIKGMFARLEIIPVDGGMSIDDVIKMFTKIAQESLKACYNMNPDVPCHKVKGEYVENEKSIYKGKRRIDFGDFTNTELTEIISKKVDISNYLSGKYAKGGQLKNDKKDTEKNKEHHEKVMKRYKEEIQNNEEIKKYIQNSKTLKDKLVDKDGNINDEELEGLSDNLIRIENNYLNKKEKKSFFKKLKDFFTGGDKNEKNNYDPEEVKTLAYKLAAIKKKKSTKKSESDSTNEDYYNEQNIILEANLEILDRDFEDYWHNEDSINESYDEDENFEFELYEV